MRRIVLRYHKMMALIIAVLGLMPGLSIGQSASIQEGNAATTARAAVDPEASNAFFQATYVWQNHPPFRARYSGANSLSPDHEKSYTFTSTAYLGFRLWSGAELYFNPEVIQGIPFSRLTGLGGLANGENQKGSGSSPTFYRARLFLRRTWGLGGESDQVGSSANQLSGGVDRRRVVMTVGNLAVIDLFDNNAYSHDPRTQFLNWSLMTHGAFDYAADARGYSWGAALEYYRDDWAVRAGRFLQPFQSNGLQLDYRVAGHYGDQIEAEHAHSIRGRQGKIRLLGFRNVARMGGFRDALDLAAARGGIPDVAKVRKDQVKYGLGISLEQEITGEIGLFARASANNGAAETYAFTEIERSVSGGVAVKGSAWNRPGDTFSIGVVRNGLSAAHRDYLASGGLGFFIGDGRLTYGTESIVEVQYAASVMKNTWLSADITRIRNPAYNSDRGPVTIAGLRLHVEY